MSMPRLQPFRGLYVITDVVLKPGRGHLEIVQAALAGGARVIQLRDKEAADADLLEEARAIRQVTRAAGALFLVNDRFELARAVDADGVHLGQGDLPAREARRRWPEAILGISVDDERTARQAKPMAPTTSAWAHPATQTKGDAGPAIGLSRSAHPRGIPPAHRCHRWHRPGEHCRGGAAGAEMAAVILRRRLRADMECRHPRPRRRVCRRAGTPAGRGGVLIVSPANLHGEEFLPNGAGSACSLATA